MLPNVKAEQYDGKATARCQNSTVQGASTGLPHVHWKTSLEDHILDKRCTEDLMGLLQGKNRGLLR